MIRGKTMNILIFTTATIFQSISERESVFVDNTLTGRPEPFKRFLMGKQLYKMPNKLYCFFIMRKKTLLWYTSF